MEFASTSLDLLQGSEYCLLRGALPKPTTKPLVWTGMYFYWAPWAVAGADQIICPGPHTGGGAPRPLLKSEDPFIDEKSIMDPYGIKDLFLTFTDFKNIQWKINYEFSNTWR